MVGALVLCAALPGRYHGRFKAACESVQVVANAVRAVRHLRGLGCEDIEFSPEDAGRSELSFLYRVLAAVIEAGATTVNIPDTVRTRVLFVRGGFCRVCRASGTRDRRTWPAC